MYKYKSNLTIFDLYQSYHFMAQCSETLYDKDKSVFFYCNAMNEAIPCLITVSVPL